jgi:dihydrofolate reductase
MRKIVVIAMITLDSVMQAPGGPKEDTSGGFKYGGWTASFVDNHMFKSLKKELSHPFDLLLGRKTYDIWKTYWPIHDDNFIGEAFNKATKYVVSTTLTDAPWVETVILNKNVVAEIKKLKRSKGPELQVHGSANLIQTLLKHDLVDELRLRIFPITLGSGKRLFDGGQIPAAFALENCTATKSGVIFANYKRNGKVKTGSMV